MIEIDGVCLTITATAQMALLRALAYAGQAGTQFPSRDELHERWLECLPSPCEAIHEKDRLNSELSSLKKFLKSTPHGSRLCRFLPQGRMQSNLSLPPHKIELQ